MTSDRRPRPRSFGHPFDIGARVVVQFECSEEGYSLDGLSFGRGAPLLPLNGRRRSMQKVNRRSAMALGLAAASIAVVKPTAAQAPDALAGKETSPGPGVVQRAYGEESSMIPGFKTVSMRDIIIQPGANTKEENVMMNAMVCHVPEGELRIVQDGKTFTAKKNYVWTCNKGTKEHAINDGKVVAIMRITDLKA
jgi:hypothetical protein